MPASWRIGWIVLAAMAPASALAQSGGAYAIVAHAMGSVAQADGPNYSLLLSSASPVALPTQGGAYRVDGGFWLGAGASAVAVHPAEESTRFSFLPPSPNPSARSVNLVFALPNPGPVRLEVLSLSGRRVDTILDGVLSGGLHQVAWSGNDAQGRAVASGIYFLRLRAGSMESTRRVVRIR